MTIRPFLMAAMMLTSLSVFAHPGKHDAAEETLIPTTCAQLADTKRYTDDVAFPEVKKLKARCDAEKKVPASPQKPST